MAASPSLVAWRTLFGALGCFTLASLTYTILTDGSPFRRDVLTPWLTATLFDFYANVVAIAVWIAYKESNYLSTIFWVFLLICFGRFLNDLNFGFRQIVSIGTCTYIVKQLFSTPDQHSSQDSVLHGLLSLSSRKDGEGQINCSSIVTGQVVFGVLGVMMSMIVVYTIITDGSPFRMELLSPWMSATLIDFYINVFAISVWVFHKESTWISAIFWIFLLICLGSIATCAYIVTWLSKLYCQGPVYHVSRDNLD